MELLTLEQDVDRSTESHNSRQRFHFQKKESLQNQIRLGLTKM